jgi:hypothetical protein
MAEKKGGITGKGFTKGDPRINRKGRPKSFDKLRELAQSLANTAAKDKDGNPLILDDGSIATQTQVILLKLMRENPEKFIEIAFGKVPQPVELSGKDGAPIKAYIGINPDDWDRNEQK